MKLWQTHRPFCKFISARLMTMVIEVGGVWLLVAKLGMNDMVGKFAHTVYCADPELCV